MAYREKEILKNPQFGSPTGVEPFRICQSPPLKKMVNIYGVNIDTERFFFFVREADAAEKAKEKSERFVPDRKASVALKNFVLRDGLAFETAETPQFSLKEAGEAQICRSGRLNSSFSSFLVLNLILSFTRRWHGSL